MAKYIGDYETKYMPIGGGMRGIMRKTKIICTIGPASDSEEKLKEYSKFFHEPEQFSGNEPELEPRMSFYSM